MKTLNVESQKMKEIKTDLDGPEMSARQVAELFHEHQQSIFKRTDQMFAALMAIQWLAGVAAAYWITPQTWAGATSQTHLHVWAALFLGGAISSLPILLALTQPGRASTRHTIAVGQMLMGALLIHLTGGRIETHFHVFGSLAFLSFYRDWRVLIPATVVVAADHFLRGIFLPQSVYGVLTASEWRWLEHAGWVLFEDTFLFIAIKRGVTEMWSIAERTAEIKSLNAGLEHHVAERTAQLVAANQELEKEVAERKLAEEQLRQAQKMEAVGKLAGGVAHDFNNLLTVINGHTDLSLRRMGQGDPLYRKLEAVKEAGERAATLTRQLLAFSRKQILQPKVLDLNHVIYETNKILQRLIGEDIDLLIGLTPDLGKVKADPNQIEQVLMNLSVNARDAMPRGGKLTIETHNVDINEEYASKHFSVQPGRYVMLAISDTGCGMDAETQARIFEPFFTTKEVGKGTGLGLATVYGIVKQSGGNVWVYSEVGRGTTFKIYLPCVDNPARELTGSAEDTQLQVGTETVLLVEDEQIVRDMTREILQESGYRVLEAKHGQEALIVAEQHHGPIHLMLSDVVMPQMSGRELAAQLTPLRKDMKVLYMSGYTDDAIVHHGVLDEGMAFIEKPFTPNALARKVRDVLNTAPKGLN
jgi:signal transduction histidine kinase/ActR/RegA family two-component response regulator